MKTIEQIKDWLIFNGVFFKVEQYAGRQVEAIHDTAEVGAKNILCCAFNWNNTPEGWYFWNDTNNRYVEWLDGKVTMSGRPFEFAVDNNEYRKTFSCFGGRYGKKHKQTH